MGAASVNLFIPTLKQTPSEDLLRRSAGHVAVCISSCRDDVICGEMHSPYLGRTIPFHGLDHLVMLMDTQMDEANFPMRDTEIRQFHETDRKNDLFT